MNATLLCDLVAARGIAEPLGCKDTVNKVDLGTKVLPKARSRALRAACGRHLEKRNQILLTTLGNDELNSVSTSFCTTSLGLLDIWRVKAMIIATS